MTTLTEGRLTFTFDQDVDAAKYDDWSFYRAQFQNGCSRANRAVDLVCHDGQCGWLIEVKDYRSPHHGRVEALPETIAGKVRDSLAGLLAASFNANATDEKGLAERLVRAGRLRVVCHIELPAKASRLRPKAIEPDKFLDGLRRLVKAVDPHPKVVDIHTDTTGLPWQVHSA